MLLAFRPLIPVIDYLVNYEYISTELCENIQQPEILCNGKCYLAKEVSKTVDDTQKPADKSVSLKIIDVFNLNSITEIQIENPLKIQKEIIYNFLAEYEFLFSQSLLKPPLV